MYAAVDELEREVLAASPRGLRAVERGRVVLACGPALGEAGDARREQERTAAADERVADGLDCGPLGRVRDGRVGEVVLVREMDDGVGILGAGADAVEIVQIAPADPGALGLRAAAEASDLASPVTSCPAASNSSTVAEPIQPDAPVTKTRMTVSPFAPAPKGD